MSKLNNSKESDVKISSFKVVRLIYSKFEDFKKWVLKHISLSIFVTSATISAVVVLIIVMLIYKANEVEYLKDQIAVTKSIRFNTMKRLDQLRFTHYRYTRVLTKEEMLLKWIELFSNSKYKLNGNPRYNTYDCSGGVHEFWKAMGSNIPMESVKTFVKRANNLYIANRIKIRRNIIKVRHGDIIILGSNKQPRHMGIVYRVNRQRVQYMDIDSKFGGLSLSVVGWKGKSVYNIYSVSYPLWTGDLLTDVNE